eukprot:237304-Alexandrium_andersonii.AAC.1
MSGSNTIRAQIRWAALGRHPEAQRPHSLEVPSCRPPCSVGIPARQMKRDFADWRIVDWSLRNRDF